jgi:hypothetical protein
LSLGQRGLQESFTDMHSAMFVQNGKTALDVVGWSCSKDDDGAREAKALLEAAMRASVHENKESPKAVAVPTDHAENRRLLRHAFSCLLSETGNSSRPGKAVVQGVVNVLRK